MKYIKEYTFYPPVTYFKEVTGEELNQISTEIDNNHPNIGSNSYGIDDYWLVDRDACDEALKLNVEGKTVLVAQDEDGYYFAIKE